jgi:arginine decarboxylase
MGIKINKMFKSFLTLKSLLSNKEEFFKNNYSQLPQTQVKAQQKSLLIGNRIPKDFFLTSGIGESDITVHAGSYHLALRDAGIERCNIVTYSSILPSIATEIPKPSTDKLVHGSVMETIMACANSSQGERATAGLIIGWLYNKETNEKFGGLVCEYHGNDSEEEAVQKLQMSLNELYTNGFSERFNLSEIKILTKSFVPRKKFGTALVALCFVDYAYPVLGFMT